MHKNKTVKKSFRQSREGKNKKNRKKEAKAREGMCNNSKTEWILQRKGKEVKKNAKKIEGERILFLSFLFSYSLLGIYKWDSARERARVAKIVVVVGVGGATREGGAMILVLLMLLLVSCNRCWSSLGCCSCCYREKEREQNGGTETEREKERGDESQRVGRPRWAHEIKGTAVRSGRLPEILVSPRILL